MKLPNYDDYITTTPEDRAGDSCMECGDRLYPDDEPLKLDEGYACSSKCEALWNLKNPPLRATGQDLLELAVTAYGEEAEPIIRITSHTGNTLRVLHVARERGGDRFFAEDEEGKEVVVHAVVVDKIEVVE